MPRIPKPSNLPAPPSVGISDLLANDKKADEMGLELCEFCGECDTCDPTRPDARTWVSMMRAEVTEVSYYICDDCLPKAHERHTAMIEAWAQMADDELANDPDQRPGK